MHWQTRSPSRERDHKLSLMPLQRPEGELSWFTGTAMLLALFIVAALACAVIP